MRFNTHMRRRLGLGRYRGIRYNKPGEGAGGAGGEPGVGGTGAGGAGGAPGGGEGEISQKVVDTLNGIVTSHIRRLDVEGTIAKALTPLSEAMTKLTESVSQVQAGAAAGAGSGDKGTGEKGKGKAETDPELLKIRAEMDELKAANTRKDEELKAQREQAKTDKLETAIKEALLAGNVDPLRIEGALEVVKKRMRQNSDGEFEYPVEKVSGSTKWEEIVTPDKGVGEWLKTDAGKSYVAARNVRGNVPGGGGGGTSLPLGGRKLPVDPKTGRPSNEDLDGLLFDQVLSAARNGLADD